MYEPDRPTTVRAVETGAAHFRAAVESISVCSSGEQGAGFADVVDQAGAVASDAVGRTGLAEAAFVHEMADVGAANQGGEVGDEATVAPPPQALGAHHGRRLRGGLIEDLVECDREVGRRHVVGVGTEAAVTEGDVR